MPHFCAAYEVSDRDFVVMEQKTVNKKTESVLPGTMKLRSGGIFLFMRMLGTKGLGLQFLGDTIREKQEVLIATVVHSHKASQERTFAYKPITIECVRNL